ncbi:RNA-binding S4 domain-containing protein [Boudabousia liubingyangii]|uniref:RNA-binding S4 domain-containing protein n=1 Tax=Boudabousia liubingyangii TaxID=1921764 RepID=UPI0009F8F888|nr:RNA-binding S4 domain-containing protein [Boudabousia liubingyangii]
MQTEGSVRVDVWLWAVRQVKTRSLATTECKAGHVRVNGDTAKPAQKIKVGDEVRYRFQGFDRILEVTGLIQKRTSAPNAQACYIDHSPPRPTKLTAPAPIIRARGTGRPTKKERRELERFMAAQRAAALEMPWDFPEDA